MVYRTMQGREIDLEKLMRQNELMPAIGNMKVNARGDEIGPGGKIVRKREEIAAAYYDSNPNARPRKIQEQAQPLEAAPEPESKEAKTITSKIKKIETTDEE